MRAEAALRSASEVRNPGRALLALGVLLGFGAPLGFLALRRLPFGPRRAQGWLLDTLTDEALVLLYMGVTTPIAFGLFGRALGRREENLRAYSEQIERLREEFAAVVAHDLRSPIQTILLQSEMLLALAQGDRAHVPVSTLRGLKRSAERLSEMVTDLLDATRIEAARLSLAPERVPLREAVASLIERLRPTLGDHPIELAVEAPLPQVRADPVRLDQILTNLVDNAAKYSAPASPIFVRVRPSGSGATVEIEDRGFGIEPSERSHLFDRFYQAKRAREKKSGLGLGLYITKGLVDAHGGRIDVRSQPGRGSTFSVWLPAAGEPHA